MWATITRPEPGLCACASLDAALKRVGPQHQITVYRSKYLNNIVEQDHRFVKRRTRPMLGFKSFASAAATLDGTEIGSDVFAIDAGAVEAGLDGQSFDSVQSSAVGDTAFALVGFTFERGLSHGFSVA